MSSSRRHAGSRLRRFEQGASTFAIIIAGSAIAAFTCLFLLTKRQLASSDAIAAAFMLLLALPMLEKLILSGSVTLPYRGSGLFSGAPLARLEECMLKAKPWLDPDPTIDDL